MPGGRIGSWSDRRSRVAIGPAAAGRSDTPRPVHAASGPEAGLDRSPPLA